MYTWQGCKPGKAGRSKRKVFCYESFGDPGFSQKCTADRSFHNVPRELHWAINVEHTTMPFRVKGLEEREVGDNALYWGNQLTQ